VGLVQNVQGILALRACRPGFGEEEVRELVRLADRAASGGKKPSRRGSSPRGSRPASGQRPNPVARDFPAAAGPDAHALSLLVARFALSGRRPDAEAVYASAIRLGLPPDARSEEALAWTPAELSALRAAELATVLRGAREGDPGRLTNPLHRWDLGLTLHYALVESGQAEDAEASLDALRASDACPGPAAARAVEERSRRLAESVATQAGWLDRLCGSFAGARA
jgi:hypothetical protein